MSKEKDEKKLKKDNYGADSIQVLEGLEPVRKRPGMYIGTTGPDGFHHLITEIFDNSRDEAMGGFADRIEVAFLSDNHIRVVDNGRGIPVDIHKQTKVSALETIMTTLHAGGKFGGCGYKVSGGLHGVGASVVNALSSFAKVLVHKEGGVYMQEYSRGKKKNDVKKIAKTEEHGTIVEFQPDVDIFGQQEFDFNRVVGHMRQQAYLVKGLRITIIDLRNCAVKIDTNKAYYLADTVFDAPSQTFYFEGGLLSLVKFYNSSQKPIHKQVFYIEKKDAEGVEGIEIALQYVDDISARIVGFANNISTPEGGTHITGFKTTLTRLINSYARKAEILKEKDDNFTGDDVLEGLTAVVSVKLREIQFEGQTKAKLGSVEATKMVSDAFSEAFSAFLEEHPDDARSIVNKSILALRARKAAKAAKDSILRKGALDGMTLPGKLADCSSNKAEETELIIVEGDSAGGTAKTGRDRRIQAVLPLRGKILNVERARLDKMLASDTIKSLVIAIGTTLGDTFDISKLRYHKIIIATDADVDGAHIRTLLLTLFYRHFPVLVEQGHIYIAQSPLYKIKKGKEVFYFYTEEEKGEFVKKEGIVLEEVQDINAENAEQNTEPDVNEEEKTDKKDKKKEEKKTSKMHVQRYKGLGEMNSDELWETTLDPDNRVLKQVSINDAAEADVVFDMLMGNDVPARKSFIQTNAKLANLDV